MPEQNLDPDVRREVYLGDGVYAQFDGYHVWVWTSDGLHPGDKIALDPSVLKALIEFAGRFYEINRLIHPG